MSTFALLFAALTATSLDRDAGNIVFDYIFDYSVLHTDGRITFHDDDDSAKIYTDAVNINVNRQFTIIKGSKFGPIIKSITGPGRVVLIGDMSNMFNHRTYFDCDVSNWDVSRVTDTSYMFYGATSFRGTGLENWDVSRVTYMRGMFADTKLFNANLSGWRTSIVTDMSYMFSGATSFIGDGLENWDVSRVNNMCEMFQDATSFNGKLSKWNVSRVTNMREMFHDATSFNGNLSKWNVSRVRSMSLMFCGATSFIGDGLENWDVSRVTDMSCMFCDARSFNCNLSKWNVSRVRSMSVMFLYNHRSLELPIWFTTRR